MHDAHGFLQTLALVFCVAAVTTVLFQRLRQPVVLGYLLAGMVVGPHVPIPIVADVGIVQTLAELGVVLLMFSLGIEFSLPKLMRVGATAAFTAIVQCSVMTWLGFVTAQAFGWSPLAGLYAGAVIAISSTTIIVKAFEERKLKADFTQIVFGVLIVEDLIAILLITILTSLSVGEQVDLATLTETAARLLAFLIAMLVGGLLIVPRLMRAVVRLDRAETTVVTAVGIAFGCALLATHYGYSAALGAFIAGSLVAESGVETTVEHLVRPVRDIFAAVFFVSVGMLIDPAAVAEAPGVVLAFFVAVVVGKVVSVTIGAMLTGRSVQTSVKCGMSLAQIGEFSFIIAGLGMSTGVTDTLLYSTAVAVSGATTLLTPWLIQAAGPTAAYVDRKLPRRLQTFLALYGSWIRQLGDRPAEGRRAAVRRLVGWLAVDAFASAAIIIAMSLNMDYLTGLLELRLGLSPRFSAIAVSIGAAILSSPFWIGMLRVVRFLGSELATRAFPTKPGNEVDLAAAPRRLLIVTLQLAIVVLVGLPLVAITQPFLPPLRGALVLSLVVAFFAFSFWRDAANFQGHTRAAAQAIAEGLALRTKESRAEATRNLEDLNRVVVGLGAPVPVPLPPSSRAVGKTLAEISLRGLTGATVLAIQRGEDAILVPSGHERLEAGDVLAVAGTSESVAAARELLLETAE